MRVKFLLLFIVFFITPVYSFSEDKDFDSKLLKRQEKSKGLNFESLSNTIDKSNNSLNVFIQENIARVKLQMRKELNKNIENCMDSGDAEFYLPQLKKIIRKNGP